MTRLGNTHLYGKNMYNLLLIGFVLTFVCVPTASNADDGSNLKLGRCVPVCTAMGDAFVAFSDASKTSLTHTNLVSCGKIPFNRPIVPFCDASVKLFTPHVPFLNHNFAAGGQIESIVSTSVVHRTTFDACNAVLINVKKIFEQYKIEFDTMTGKSSEEYGFETKNPTWGGWSVYMSVRRLSGNSFIYTMVLRRKRPQKNSPTDVQVDVDI